MHFLLICSLLYVEAADRPGLLVDLVKMITDINIAVESGEFDTEVITKWLSAFSYTWQLYYWCYRIVDQQFHLHFDFGTQGLLAKAKFHVSYRGKAIIKPLQQVKQDIDITMKVSQEN